MDHSQPARNGGAVGASPQLRDSPLRGGPYLAGCSRLDDGGPLSLPGPNRGSHRRIFVFRTPKDGLDIVLAEIARARTAARTRREPAVQCLAADRNQRARNSSM